MSRYEGDSTQLAHDTSIALREIYKILDALAWHLDSKGYDQRVNQEEFSALHAAIKKIAPDWDGRVPTWEAST
ncbi:hypothetical protein J2W56_001291 [Nocardia kruczakiae]|uniref:Uncharacterized protein n=1 Tax=Nocardia kruczakiae TaxID=261477 RepID=A0ABU1XAK6_9NOCA|nr:hypothetical protein [Nocardia kruczakiae]MDR7167572.1 hypothetical protein [Nocardia kruczakiae]